jgi:hypothetical protein
MYLAITVIAIAGLRAGAERGSGHLRAAPV